MIEHPVLSICIPTYDRAWLLKEALASILAQINELNRGKLEIVIADNSSDRETEALVAQISQDTPVPIRYQKNKTNLGFDRNLLTTVELAKGEYCWFLGDDDLIAEGALDLILSEIATNQQVDVFIGNKQDYNEDLTSQLRFVPLFKENKDKTYNFKQPDLAQYFLASQRLICFFNYISILVVRRGAWLTVPVPAQIIGMGYIHVYMTMSLLFTGHKGVLKYLAKPIAKRRWSRDRIPNITERLHLDVAFYHLASRKILGQPRYVRAIERLLIKDDGFSWAVRARLDEGLNFYLKTFPFLFRYYWSYPLFWLKILPLLFMPATALTLLRNLGLKFIKGKKIAWQHMLQNSQGWEKHESIRPGLERARFVTANELAELRTLVAGENADLVPHVASRLGLNRYVKNAKRIKRYLAQGRILDWGCGLGQMSYLLKNRGFEVVSYDVDAAGQPFLERIGQQLVLASDPAALPFPDAHFDAVLSSGVLEHVADPLASLKEVGRVLKDQGYFFIFMLPNKYSYIEYLSDRLGRGDHPVKYSRQQICQVLSQFNFEVLDVRYKGLLPYNLKGFPSQLRNIYHLFDGLIEKLDVVMSQLPGLRLLSTNLELVARKNIKYYNQKTESE